eukprot:2040761-Pyramimonas_sp.AAC.1
MRDYYVLRRKHTLYACDLEGITALNALCFPTMIYLAKGSLEATVYEGEQTADAVVEFITERAGGVSLLNLPSPACPSPPT